MGITDNEEEDFYISEKGNNRHFIKNLKAWK